jgi:hypothetical protein
MAAKENANYERAITVRRSAGRLRYLRERQASLSNRCATSDGFYLVRHGRKGRQTITGELLGTDGQHQKTEEVLCQEHILQSDRRMFRIRPRDDKHPVLCLSENRPSSAYIKTSCYYGFRNLMAKSANILSSDIAGR